MTERKWIIKFHYRFVMNDTIKIVTRKPNLNILTNNRTSEKKGIWKMLFLNWRL